MKAIQPTLDAVERKPSITLKKNQFNPNKFKQHLETTKPMVSPMVIQIQQQFDHIGDTIIDQFQATDNNLDGTP
jgi:hypothetical protein